MKMLAREVGTMVAKAETLVQAEMAVAQTIMGEIKVVETVLQNLPERIQALRHRRIHRSKGLNRYRILKKLLKKEKSQGKVISLHDLPGTEESKAEEGANSIEMSKMKKPPRKGWFFLCHSF